MQSKTATLNVRKNGGERSRRERPMVTVPIAQPEPRRHSDMRRGSGSSRPSSRGPGVLVEGPGGVMTYMPIGGSPTRPRSSTSQSQSGRRGTPPLTYREPHQGSRHFSEGFRPTSSSNARIPLPHEEGWDRSSRRSSVSSQNHGAPDPFQYQVADRPPPIPGQFQEPRRRHVSGPVSYSSVQRPPAMTTGSSSSSRLRHSMGPSDSHHDRRRDLNTPSSDEDSYSSDELSGGGAPVVVERPVVIERPPERPPAPAPVSAVKGKEKGNGNGSGSSGSGKRKGRR
jgi:hypothetical protein